MRGYGGRLVKAGRIDQGVDDGGRSQGGVDGGRSQDVDVADDIRGTTNGDSAYVRGSQGADRKLMDLSDAASAGDQSRASAMIVRGETGASEDSGEAGGRAEPAGAKGVESRSAAN
ncbi:hypothetical protein PO909_015291 [Leuciscus waleckii]